MSKTERLLQLIQDLSQLNGPSGQESSVRDYVIAQIKNYASYRVDALGNIIAEKKGDARPSVKIMLDAHMDEVGVIVTTIRPDGLLQFETVGGIGVDALFGKRIAFDKTKGVIGGLPLHFLSSDQKQRYPSLSNLYIDIGCTTQEQAQQLVSVGDMGVFDSQFTLFGDGFMKAKALDDRVGCAILIDMIQSDLPYDMTFTFTVREEVGLVGAKTAAFQVQPQVALVLETTTAADVAGSTELNRVCALKNGVVVSFMDRATLYHKDLYDFSFKIAKRNGIAIQSKNAVAGGNNAGAIHGIGGGIPTLALSLPCRYLHSPSCVIHEFDLLATAKMAKYLSIALASGEKFAETL